eukprot:CAMPEP_0172888920 /NCGR_PEP_ID=MMETSP1075-20121228/137520_1 /TAXON_ID=2916 /ORGANISM="Ceratium fusus, Strain PA161109" /LENGTH=37 /DNA_ID= /DNA_START= /DNA_END= /DNA_ORIENTATION=
MSFAALTLQEAAAIEARSSLCTHGKMVMPVLVVARTS